MTEDERQAVCKEIWIEASPETVFAFLTDPARIIEWIGLRAELEPRPGGIFRVDVNGRDVIRGNYLEIIPNRKVSFSWGYEAEDSRIPAGSTTVEITLEPDGGGTTLRLVHRGLEKKPREDHDQGWVHYLNRLSTCATGGRPGPDPLGTLSTRHGR